MPFSVHRRISGVTESWFREAQRPLPWRLGYDPYMVWVSEVMLQQTRMEVVLRYFERFIDHFPDVRTLASSREEEVLAAWSGLGYYRRARMLLAGAREVVSRFGGSLPDTVAELRTIPGIGPYTAGAISSIAFNERAPIVDGNVARIISRLFAIEEPVASPALMRASWKHAADLVRTSSAPRDFNQGLMEIGALVCRPQRPACHVCPLSAHCLARQSGRTGELPKRRVERASTAMTIPLLVISDRAGRLLMRRESGKLMNAMYHLPHGNTSLFSERPLEATTRTLIGTFHHTITTRRIEFQIFAADLGESIRDGRGEYAWIDPARMADVPHPSYVAKALRLVAMPGL
ncbi:MAG TPA: A/G-specific adenine glycosylase [Thermoanaerobaculia bacterium]|nr:A/G-specific adenine glycosylase [Thermoanaerobaculia bacterium]